MKKRIFILLSSLLILNIFIISINSQDTLISNSDLGNINPETGLPSELEDIKQTSEKLTDEKQRTEYLKQEWEKILKDNKFFSPIISFLEFISPVTNPLFKYTIGVEPSLSWLFFLTLTLWIALVIYIFRIFDLISIFSKWLDYIISFGAVIAFSLMGITKKLAEVLINTISLFSIWWMQLIGVVILIIALIVASIFSKNLQEVFKAIKEKKEKAEEEMNREKLKSNVKVAEALTKSITK